MKKYEVEATVYGTGTCEDPKCPFAWRGSGVYDREVSLSRKITCDVWASCEEDAKIFVEEYDYEKEFDSSCWESAEVRSIKFTGEEDDDDTLCLDITDMEPIQEVYLG